MRSKGLTFTLLTGFISVLIVNTVSAFDVSLFFPGMTVYSGTTVGLSLKNAPSRVNVKFAVQNADNSLTSIESSTVYNVVPDSMATHVRITDAIEPGINYWVVAIDASNSANYATFGPFSIFKPLGSNPTSSVTIDSGIAYATGGSTAALPSATGQVGSSKATPTPTPTPTGPTSTKGTTTSASETPGKSPQPTDDGSSIKLSLGAIVGIAVGAAVGGAIIALIAYYILFKKCRQPRPVLPVASQPRPSRPNNNSTPPVQPVAPRPVTRPTIPNNNSTVPMTETSSGTINIESDITPTVKAPLSPPNAQTTISSLPQTPSPQTLATELPESVPGNTLNASTETTFKYQYPPNFAPQPGYPPYAYIHNSNQHSMSYYPMNDSMPAPEHHFGANNGYPPLSPTFYNYPPSQQQPYPPYPPHQLTQINASSNAFYISPAAAKTEAGTASNDDTVLAQKVEYDGITADNKAEYHQKPDTVIDEQFVYNKPNRRQ